MRIETHGQQIEVTPALRDYVADPSWRASAAISTSPSTSACCSGLDPAGPPRRSHRRFSGRTLHADASGRDMYAAIDLLADKLDRLLVKHKEKMVDHHRGESPARSGDFA